ncbi:MAG: fatty acid desaturase family protein, partial [Hyphomicrobiaceae bacterium]|nr:fatty acid desaturase family protein [Hyphomicrobiaceae bacterium]
MSVAADVAPRRLPAKSFLSEAQLVEVRTRTTWRGVAMIVHAWAVIIAAIAMAVIWPNPLTWVLAIAVIGSRQLGLAILMHDGAHGLLANETKLNLFLSQWLCAYPVLAETRAYRRYHLQHHAHTQTEQDPDLVLSAPFPITEASYRRKFIRDITGQTGFEQRKAQVLNAMGDGSLPWRQRGAQFVERLGPQALFQVTLCVALTVIAGWWVYPVLWVVPLLTWYQVVTRIRNIAEHAVISDSNDPLRNTRTTLANWLERAFIAPYFVNYHLEHHLVFYVPAYNLPRVHQILMAGPLRDRVEIERGYGAVLRKATTRPLSEDRPG